MKIRLIGNGGPKRLLDEPFLLDLTPVCPYIVATMMKKLLIEKVPDNRDLDGVKRWEEEKGEFVQIAYEELIRHLA
jgi:hypothetical protein